MKNTTFVLLCCCVLLAACDKSNDTASEQRAGIEDKADTVVTDTASVVRDAGEKAAVELNGALESAKDAADNLADIANESASDAIDAGSDLKDSVVEGADAAVETVKDMSTATATKTGEMLASAGNDDASQGESIYKSKCNACHGAGVAGAPKLGDKAAWSARITQGNAVLLQHAIEGYKGKTGYMPAKGGYMDLSDDDVTLAVQYMVSKVQ